MAVVTVDLGGSHISAAVIHGAAVLASERRPTEALSLSGELPAIAAMVNRMISASGLSSSSLAGVALGFCGVVDGETGEILSTLNKYPDAATVDLQKWAEREFALPLRMENDACLALLGEAACGAAQGSRDVVMVTLGTGIGAAAMIGGKLLRSRAGQAGCLGGHLPVKYDGRLCSCGAVGCAEAEASTAVLPDLLRQQGRFPESSLSQVARPDFRILFRAADAGDAVARSVIEHCLHVWSVLAVGLVHAYGPQLMLFGGGVMERGSSLLDPIRAYVEAHMWRTSRGLPVIARAQLGQDAALLGGASLFSVPEPPSSYEYRKQDVHV